MKVLILSAWEDTGGVGIALKQALERHTNWSARFVHRHYNYINYPTDIYWELGAPMPSGLVDLFREADVIHVMERWSAVIPFDGWREKPLVMHHHGTEFRVDNTAELIRTTAEYRAVGIVSTPDLLLIDQSLTWLPNPCDIDRMRTFRTDHAGLRIAHSPTNRAIKATEAFLTATEGSGLDVDVIEGVDWETCLTRKAQADLFFDQLHIGYALSGIEAMAMGIPVVSGAYDHRIIDLMMSIFGYLPFLLAEPTNLRDRIGHLIDPTMRRAFAAIGTYHVERWHAEDLVARRLVEIYERALAR